MRPLRPQAAFALSVALSAALSGCQQSDQALPFEVDPAQLQTVSLNAAGGIVSVPPNFSLEFFPGTLAGSQTVTAQQRLTAFPSAAGIVVPGTAFDVGPAGTALSPSVPARVQIAVPAALLQAGQELALTVGLLRPDNSIVTGVTSYDVTNGLLTANLSELGPVAAVISNDAITVGSIASLPPLGGGAISPVSPNPVGPALAPTRGGVEFSAECSPGERSCLTSGIAQLWVDDVVRERLGDDLVLVNTTVEASLEFFSFRSAVPDSAVGYLRIDGDLRARINSVIASRKVGDEVTLYTGNGSDPYNPDPTAISLSGSALTFEFTSRADDPQTVEFDISGVGTSDLLTVQIEGTVDLANASGPPTVGKIVAQVRLRR
jgi:hypothetical protein